MTIKEFITSRIHSFGHAFRGWWHVLKTQQNAWIHVVVSVTVFILAFWLKLSAHDWAIIIITVTIVFTAEFINTAIETVVDLASPGQHPLAKIGKDVGAAAVLIAALAAVLIGFLILGPPLWQRVRPWLGGTTVLSRAEETTFKGMEFYSWKNESGAWQYAILTGTNRNKTLDEVLSVPFELQEVKQELGRLAVGESLIWMNKVYDTTSGQMVDLPYPPDEVIHELQDLAHDKQIKLYVP